MADVFEVPLDFLMDPANHRRHAWDWEGTVREWYSMPYDDAGQERFIWGATAGMLRNFYRLADRLSLQPLRSGHYDWGMSFFAILIALSCWSKPAPWLMTMRCTGALRAWARLVRRNLDAGEPAHGWLAWVLAAGVPALFAGAGLLGVVAASARCWPLSGWSAVLYVTVGFRQFSHHFTDIRQALETGDELGAREKLARWLRVEAASLPRAELLRQVIEHAVLAAHRHVFGVLTCFGVFWVLGLGPAGAIFYRMAEYLSRNWRERADGTPSTAMQKAAKQGWNVVDFVPARVTALGFAIVGNFEESVASWRGEAERFAPGNDGVLLAATSGALGVRLSQTVAADDADSSVEGGFLTERPRRTADLPSGQRGGAGVAQRGAVDAVAGVAHAGALAGLIPVGLQGESGVVRLCRCSAPSVVSRPASL